MEIPKNEWFIREHPIEIDDLGVPPILGNLHISAFLGVLLGVVFEDFILDLPSSKVA